MLINAHGVIRAACYCVAEACLTRTRSLSHTLISSYNCVLLHHCSLLPVGHAHSHTHYYSIVCLLGMLSLSIAKSPNHCEHTHACWFCCGTVLLVGSTFLLYIKSKKLEIPPRVSSKLCEVVKWRVSERFSKTEALDIWSKLAMLFVHFPWCHCCLAPVGTPYVIYCPYFLSRTCYDDLIRCCANAIELPIILFVNAAALCSTWHWYMGYMLICHNGKILNIKELYYHYQYGITIFCGHSSDM